MTDQKIPLEPPPNYEDAAQPLNPAAPQTRQGGQPRLPLPLDLPALNMIRGKRVILASASPRRRQLLASVRPPSLRTNPTQLKPPRELSLSPAQVTSQTLP